MPSAFRCLLAALLAVAAPLHAVASDFAVPAEFVRDVEFWKRVYSEVTTRAGLVHDDRNLAVVYEVLVFPEGISREGRQRMVEAARSKYAGILRTLASGKREGLTEEEARVLALWGPNVQDRTLELAVDRVRFQLGQRDRFIEGMQRSGRWEQHIARTLAERGLPPELSALPHVESSFNPRAGSKVGAAGLWQFMPSTGRRWLRVDNVVDERYDPYKSTVAAAQYLQLNHRILGTWPLALTAYNHGAGGMRRAKEMMGTDDIVTIARYYVSPTFGFASRNFYVSFLAALAIDREPEKHLGPVRRDPLDDSIAVPLTDYVPVAALERVFEVERETLRELNLALRGAVWDGQRAVPRGFVLRVPARPGLEPAARLAALKPGEKLARQAGEAFHTVRRGDTLGAIARKHGTSVAWLKRNNGLRDGDVVRVGQVLKLPGRMPGVPRPAPLPAAGEIYVVARGDTLSEIAARAGIAERELMALNSIRDRDSLFVGQRLRLKPSGAAPEQGADEEAGELLAAEQRGTAEPQLARAEEAETVTAEPAGAGPVAVAGAASTDPTDYSVAADGTIVVAGAETLGHIAEWLEVRAQRLRELNRMRAGQALSLGRRLKLDLSVVDAAEFERRRTAFHRQLQEQFFSAWRVAGTERATVRAGETLWLLTQRRRNVPVWLLRQYNPDVNLEDLRPGVELTWPVVEAVDAPAG